MYKSSLLTLAILSVATSAVASTQTVNLSPQAAHTLDLTGQGCTVEKAFFGNPSAAQYLEVNLDQPQPQTQKITLRWKSKPDTEGVYLQLHLQGCSQDYAQINIQRVDTPPASPVTYVSAPNARIPAEQIPPIPTGRPTQPPVGIFPPGQKVAAGQPLTLNLVGKAPSTPQPQPLKRPPVRRVLPTKQLKTITSESIQPNVEVKASSILKGLNIARNRGEIGYRSDMHYRVNGMIRAMRRGATLDAASQKAGVPASVVEALIRYSQP